MEYIREGVKVKENVGGVTVISFKVPPHRIFATEEITYLSLPLNVDEKFIVNKIAEMKYGRKTVEKLYAVRLDVDNPWMTLGELTLPDLLSNDIDGTQCEAKGDIFMAAYLHVNGIRNFLKIVAVKKVRHVEISIIRLAGYKGVVRYLVYF